MDIKDLSVCPEHLNTLAKWHHNEWKYLNPEQTLKQRISKMKNYLKDDFVPSTFVAFDGKVLGSAAIVENDMETKPELTPWLASVFVSPQSRNRGTGGKLVKHIMQNAKIQTLETLYLYTPDKESFYNKLGWETIEYTKYRGVEVTVMKIDL